VTRIEGGKRLPSVELLRRLLAVCGFELVLDARERAREKAADFGPGELVIPFDRGQMTARAQQWLTVRTARGHGWDWLRLLLEEDAQFLVGGAMAAHVRDEAEQHRGLLMNAMLGYELAEDEEAELRELGVDQPLVLLPWPEPGNLQRILGVTADAVDIDVRDARQWMQLRRESAWVQVHGHKLWVAPPRRGA
jgi:hypothetical protein